MTWPLARELTLTDTFISSVADGSPEVLPVTLAYAKEHIRALGTSDDTLTAIRIRGAASYFEEQTGRPCLTENRQAGLSAFPFVGLTGSAARIELPHPPLQTVLDVQYIDGDGVLQSFEGGSPTAPLWRAVTYPGAYGRRGYVEPLYGQAWPIARDETDSVRITYTCGYGDTADDLPALARGVLCWLIAHFDKYPAPVVEGGATELPLGLKTMMDGFKYSAYPSQVLRLYGSWLNGATMWVNP